MPDLKGVGNASPSVVLQHHIDPWEQGLGCLPIDLLCHRQHSSRNAPWATKHTTGRKTKVGKEERWESIWTTLGLILPCDSERTRSGMEPQAFVLFFPLSWEKTGITALPTMGDNCCTLRADTLESLPSFLAVKLWQGVRGEKGWDANLVLWDTATNTHCLWREGGRNGYLWVLHQAMGCQHSPWTFQSWSSRELNSDPHLHMSLRVSIEIYPTVFTLLH